MSTTEYLQKHMDSFMERNSVMEKVVKISEMPFDKNIDDYPDDTIFSLDEEDEEDWDPEE